MVVNITTIHLHYQVVTILGSNVHYSDFTVYNNFNSVMYSGRNSAVLELPGMEAQSNVRYANMAMFSHTLQRSLILVISVRLLY